MSLYKVMVDDNFHYREEDERWEFGTFAAAEAAIAACRKLVDVPGGRVPARHDGVGSKRYVPAAAADPSFGPGRDPPSLFQGSAQSLLLAHRVDLAETYSGKKTPVGQIPSSTPMVEFDVVDRNSVGRVGTRG
jgi:hypothetical protein